MKTEQSTLPVMRILRRDALEEICGTSARSSELFQNSQGNFSFVRTTVTNQRFVLSMGELMFITQCQLGTTFL